jgi:hypothetical protein
MVFLAYALFILFFALPFFVALLAGAMLLSGVTMLVKGLWAASLPAITLGLLLIAGAGIVGYVGWQWLASWEVGAASLDSEQPVTPDMAARPRTLVVGRIGPGRETLLAVLRDRSFDRIVGERRALPMPKAPANQTGAFYAQWYGQWFEGRASDDPGCAAPGADPMRCIAFTELPEAARGPRPRAFGFHQDDQSDRLVGRFYHFADGTTTYLYRCSVPFRLPRHPFFQLRFHAGGGYRLALERLRACEAEAMARMTADLARM